MIFLKHKADIGTQCAGVIFLQRNPVQQNFSGVRLIELVQQIDELHEKGERLKRRLSELESLIAEQELTDTEFDLMCQTLSNVEESIDQYTIEQKRAVIKALVRKIVWDGENAHLYLFNSDGDYEFPAPPTGGDGTNKKARVSGKSRETPDGSDEPLGEDSK